MIDLGPEGGEGGGQIVATGTPEEVMTEPRSHTAEALRKDDEGAAMRLKRSRAAELRMSARRSSSCRAAARRRARPILGLCRPGAGHRAAVRIQRRCLLLESRCWRIPYPQVQHRPDAAGCLPMQLVFYAASTCSFRFVLRLRYRQACFRFARLAAEPRQSRAGGRLWRRSAGVCALGVGALAAHAESPTRLSTS